MTNPFALNKTDRDAVKVAVTPPPPPRACSKCGGRIGGANKSGVCTPCQKPNRKRAGRESLVLDPAGFLGEAAQPPASRPQLLEVYETATQGRPALPEIPSVTEMRSVSRTLGLDGDQILSAYASAWLERVLSAARQAADVPTPPKASIPCGTALPPDPLEHSLSRSEPAP